MNNPLVLAGVAVLALLVGLLLGWLASRSRTTAMAASAAAEAKSSVQAELATQAERASATSAALLSERQERASLQQRTDDYRTQLDTASNEIARLTERASRVPELENELTALDAALKTCEVELRQVSTVHGQIAERATQLGQQLGESNSELDETRRQLQSVTASLQQANEARAGLEEQARRVPVLQNEVASLETSLEARTLELREISTANGKNAERAAQLAQQLLDSNEELTQALQRLEATSSSLQHTNESRAAFEQQAHRVPGLERQLMEASQALAGVRDEFANLRESNGAEISRLGAELVAERETLSQTRQEGAAAKSAASSAESRVSQLVEELTKLRTRTDDERTHSEEKLQMLLQAKEALSDQFKALANEILEEKAKRFAEQNQLNLGQLLEPLRNQLTDFKGKVEEVYVQEGKDRSALSEQVRQLVSLNQTLSEDAKNLTLALKGQAKTQGNWGELILERVLEASGLRKGFEYKVQDSQVREDGSRAQPDVVIELPEERKLVVDAKVSLVAYERFMSAGSDEERALAVKQHLNSVREHIRGLSDKSYHQLYGLQSLDFVLAFVPVEPAFMLAVTSDNELFMDAWQRNVLLVSPSTLLFVVRTVAHLWRQEAQTRNAQDIAKRGAALYDKLVGFAVDLQRVGEKLGQAKASYDEAHAKLATGNGNVIRQAEMLKSMGVKPTKLLPKGLVDEAGLEDESSGSDASQVALASPLGLQSNGLPAVSLAPSASEHRDSAPGR